MDKAYEVKEKDKRDINNKVDSWGTRDAVDADFSWSDTAAIDATLYTIDGEARECEMNQFSARLNNRCKARGGASMTDDAWLNLTVYRYTDGRSGVFDLRQTGNVQDLVALEKDTVYYLVDAANWPFHDKKDDLVALQMTATLIETIDGRTVTGGDLTTCPKGGKPQESQYTGSNGYGKSKSKSKSSSKKKSNSKSSKGKGSKNNDVAGNPYGSNYGKKSKGKKGKSKSKGDGRRRLQRGRGRGIMEDADSADGALPVTPRRIKYRGQKYNGFTNDYGDARVINNQRQLLQDRDAIVWERNELEAGYYGGSSHVFSGELADDVYSNYAFVVKFDLETIARATVVEEASSKSKSKDSDVATETVVDIETVWVEQAESGIEVEYTHYFPKFDALRFAGGALFYEPTYEYWRQRNVTHALDSDEAINDNIYNGEDQNDDVVFKTEPVETENGFFSKLWASMSLQNWMFVFLGVFAFLCIACSTCAWVFYKIKQNTHENNDAFTAMD